MLPVPLCVAADTGNQVLSQTTDVLQEQKQLLKQSDKKLKTLKRQATGDR